MYRIMHIQQEDQMFHRSILVYVSIDEFAIILTSRAFSVLGYPDVAFIFEVRSTNDNGRVGINLV